MTVTAHFNGQVFVPDGPVDLPMGCRVRVVVEPIENAGSPLAELLAEIHKLPVNMNWPIDGAAQHDHYLYSTPKKP